jgi:glycyl-tRNA synthetase beta chain
MVLDGGLRLKLDEAIGAALAGYAGVVDFDVAAVGAAVKTFFVGRLETMLRDRGHAFDTVDAVLAVSSDDPSDALHRCAALTAARATEAMADVAIAYARARNLGKPELGAAYDRSLMGPAEVALADAMEDAEPKVRAAAASKDYEGALAVLASLRAPIDTFFTDVLVMDEDAGLRDNRLRLLNRFTELFAGVADFSRLQG